MTNLEKLKVLGVKDQIIICVTDAVNEANRYLEPVPRFSRQGQLLHVECRNKLDAPFEVFRLNAQYNECGALHRLGDNIEVDVSFDLINYCHIYRELLKIIPSPAQTESRSR